MPTPQIRVYDAFVRTTRLRGDLVAMHDELLLSLRDGARVWRIAGTGRATAPAAVRALARRVLACVGGGPYEAVEYWTNSAPAGTRLPLHTDKDEELFRRSGRVVSPALSAVYYADACRFTGGALEVASVLVAPRTDRLVVFAGDLPHAVRRVTKGTRRSLVLNLWRHAPATRNRRFSSAPDDHRSERKASGRRTS